MNEICLITGYYPIERWLIAFLLVLAIWKLIDLMRLLWKWKPMKPKQ